MNNHYDLTGTIFLCTGFILLALDSTFAGAVCILLGGGYYFLVRS